MASAGIRKRVSARTHRVSYQVWWLLDDGSQGATTVASRDEAKELLDEKRLEIRRGTWRGRQRGRLSFSAWATEWWETWAADDRSQTTLAGAEIRSGYMCGPGSPTGRSTRSPPPTCAAGKPNWPGTSGRQRWPTAGHWHCGSSSSP